MKENYIFLPPQPRDTVVQIHLAGISHCDASYQMKRDCSDTCVFEYIVSGSGFCRIGDEIFYPAAGDVYIIPEYSNHEYRSSPDNPWEKLWFNITGPLASALLDVYKLSGQYYFPNCPVEDTFRRCLKQLADTPADVHYLAPGIVLDLISAIASSRSGEITSGKLPRRRQKIQMLLEEYIYQPIPLLETIARRLNMSVPQLIRIFKEEFQTTPHRYLLSRKIEIAGIFLSNTDKPVKLIAAELSFQDPYYFSNIFKKFTGKSPSRFRSQFRQ